MAVPDFTVQKVSERITRIFGTSGELWYLVVGDEKAALLDSGFAAALMKLLCGIDPERYSEAAREAERLDSRSRREEAAAHERNKRIGKRRNNV